MTWKISWCSVLNATRFGSWSDRRTFHDKNICATLDFNKSVKTFQLNVTKLLEFSNITEWDGKKLKEREEEIDAGAANNPFFGMFVGIEKVTEVLSLLSNKVQYGSDKPTILCRDVAMLRLYRPIFGTKNP
jgi:hypothetical protein